MTSNDSKSSVVAWCAGCEASLADVDDQWLTGRRFRCPKSGFSDHFHVAAIVPKDATRWLRFQQGLVKYARNPRLPRTRWFHNHAGAYVGTQLTLQLIALALVHTSAWPLCVLLSAAILLDALAYNAMVAFVTQHAQIPLRSVLFAVLTFFQFGAAYAVFYAALAADQFNDGKLNVASAFYFSIVTMATVGYGDISPNGAMGQLLVVTEIALGVFFLASIVSTIASWANGGPGLPTLDELRVRAERK